MVKQLSPIIGRKNNKFAVFDIETRNWIYPYAVGFYDGETYTQFLGKHCISDFVNHVLRKKYRGYIIYAHNGGRFDFNFLLDFIKDKHYEFDLVFQGSRCLMIKVWTYLKKDEQGNTQHSDVIRFSDSYALLKFSLDKLTTDFNVTHKKINFMEVQGNKKDFEYLYELYKKKDSRFSDYLKNDCLGLYEVLETFNSMIEKHNGQSSLTIASSALKTFQKGYLKHKLVMSNETYNERMKKAYYGGRTEIFRMFLDDGKYRCYDVNSLYPFVMFENDFPISRPHTINHPSRSWIKKYYGITECIIETPKDLYIPLLPFRLQIRNYHKLVFPLGRFRGFYDNHLLRKAFDLGYKIKPLRMMYFAEHEPIFKDYMKEFYSLKKISESGTPSYIIAKLLMNALYGKFAQSQNSEKIVKIDDVHKLKNLDFDVFDVDNNLYRVKTKSKGNFFIPQLSIHVTALSQLVLYEYMEKLINKGCIVANCDTDSLFTNGYLHSSNRLGGMKKEYDFNRGYFLLPKTYCIVSKNKTNIKAKGYIGEFQKQLSENSFRKALFKKDYSDFKITSEKPSFNTMKTSYVRHKNYVSTDVIKKSICSTYDKRVILDDYNTKPLFIGNI